VREVQDVLDRQILVENLSSYLAFTSSQLTEWEFLSALVEESAAACCSTSTTSTSTRSISGSTRLQYIAGVPPAAVQEIHLAGHLRKQSATESC